jgi:hypothetical protein
MSQELQLNTPMDNEAISIMVNRHLKPQWVTAIVAQTPECLQLMLEGMDVPHQARLTALVTKELQKAGLLGNVQIFGRQSGSASHSWVESFAIGEAEVTAIEATPENPVFGAGDYKRLAREGNLEALQAFVEESLNDRPEMTPIVEFADGILKVTIQTAEFMDGQAFSSDFGKMMNEVASKQVRELELYKQKSEQAAPFLVNKMTLIPSKAK